MSQCIVKWKMNERPSDSMLSFGTDALCLELGEKFLFAMPRVVPDQRSTFESDELFRKLSRECEVRYTGFRDRPMEERQLRFQAECREGHADLAFVCTGTTLQLNFSANSWSERPEDRVLTREYVDFDSEPGKVHLKSQFILNGVCVLWRGWVDLVRLDGVGCLEFDRERAERDDVEPSSTEQLEDLHLQDVAHVAGRTIISLRRRDRLLSTMTQVELDKKIGDILVLQHAEDSILREQLEQTNRRVQQFEERHHHNRNRQQQQQQQQHSAVDRDSRGNQEAEVVEALLRFSEAPQQQGSIPITTSNPSHNPQPTLHPQHHPHHHQQQHLHHQQSHQQQHHQSGLDHNHNHHHLS